MSTVFATTIRRDDEIYSADDPRSFITLQSMLILLALISFVLLCLCGCVLLGRNTNTLFTYKNDYITNSRYHSQSSNESHGTDATTTASAAAASNNNTNTNTNTDVASPNTLVMHSSISLSEYEMIELSSKCFGTVVVRTATTSAQLSQPQQQQHDGDDLTNQVMHHSIMQAEFHGNDIIDLSNNSQTTSLEVANHPDHPDHQYLHQNACCIICLVDYVHGDSIYRNHPNCLHIFHTRCIQQWVQQQQSQSQAPVAATSSPQHSGNISSECPCCRCPIHPILRSNPNSK